MSDPLTAILAALVGGFLAAATGWGLDRERERAKLKKARNLLKTGILDDLQHSLALYDQIIADWEKTQTVWFATLIELKNSRDIYDKHKQYILLFENEQLRKDIFRYYLQSGELISTLEWNQQRKYSLHDDWNRELHKAKLTHPDQPEDNLKTALAAVYALESQEYDRSSAMLENNVQKIPAMRQRALDILKALNQVK
ncbi:MAG: hypothetical protein KDD69_00655 [Bdellovibrionales bacterium]|nr:hypothetical protein [Bdellovibrionales bacterium]